VANTLAYYDTATITDVKSFIVQAPGTRIVKHYGFVCYVQKWTDFKVTYINLDKQLVYLGIHNVFTVLAFGRLLVGMSQKNFEGLAISHTAFKVMNCTELLNQTFYVCRVNASTWNRSKHH